MKYIVIFDIILFVLKYNTCTFQHSPIGINNILFEGNRLCDEGVNIVECYSDPCSTTHCPNFDNALCIPNHCGECSAHYYNSTGHDITMMCSKYCYECIPQ